MMSYPLKFRAAILEVKKKPLIIEEIEFPGPLLAGQVLVKLCYSGICGKQIEEIDGMDGSDKFIPHLLGHEGSAEVLDIGEGVKKVKKGDRVVLHWMKGSGIHSQTPFYSRKGSRINAGWVTTFNELAVVSENRLTVIPKDSDLLIAALLGCAVTTGVGVVVNEACVQPYDTVVVYGCGGVGLCAVQAAHMRNPLRLIAIDINEKALKFAHDFGATEVINSRKEDVIRRVKDITSGAGATKVIICTGNPSAIETAVETASVPGECFLLGVPPRGSMVSIDPYAVMHKRSLKGTLGGNSFPDRDIPAYLKLHNSGHLQLDKLVTHIGMFNDINNAIDIMRSDMPGRCAIKF